MDMGMKEKENQKNSKSEESQETKSHANEREMSYLKRKP